MPPNYGTRSRQTTPQIRAPSRSINDGYSRDLGMSKLVSASVTFVNSTTNQLQTANGTFAAFAAEDQIEVIGANLNNGVFTVQAIDTVNHAYLQVYEGVKNEGPITCTVRTP